MCRQAVKYSLSALRESLLQHRMSKCRVWTTGIKGQGVRMAGSNRIGVNLFKTVH